jgi:CRISPR-associated protein Csx14
MHWQIDPTNLGEVLACAGIARLAWLRAPDAVTGFEGARFSAADDALHGLTPSLEQSAHDGLLLCGQEVDWWQPWGLNPALKHWSGQQTPITVHRHSVEQAADAASADWPAFSAGAKGQLYVDTRAMWQAEGLGWSLNEHNDYQIAGRPWLDLLASLGLQAFRVAGSRAHGFEYHLWRPAPLPVAVAAFAGHGVGTYSAGGYRAATDKSGKVTYLLPAHPL